MAQLTDLYRQVERTWIAPFSRSDIDNPAGRLGDFVKLADQISTLLHDSINRVRGSRVNRLPMQHSRYRYVSMQPGVPTATHLAIGVFDGIARIPLAIRWRKEATAEEAIARLEASGVALQHDSGHVYVPLHVPSNAAHHDVVEAVLAQVDTVIAEAAPELRPLAFTREDAQVFIAAVRWQFAKTMPQWPHEYTVREWQIELEQEFLDFAALIRRDGTVKPWPRDSATPRYHHAYLELDGWEYWTMEEVIGETTLINRAVVTPPEVSAGV